MPEPFYFFSELHLVRLLGVKAKNPSELLEHIKQVPPSAIYYHTHRFLQQHHYLSPEPPNDFAYWVTNILALEALLLQIVFQAEIFSERGLFNFADVATAINRKLLHRHPHVFPRPTVPYRPQQKSCPASGNASSNRNSRLIPPVTGIRSVSCLEAYRPCNVPRSCWSGLVVRGW